MTTMAKMVRAMAGQTTMDALMIRDWGIVCPTNQPYGIVKRLCICIKPPEYNYVKIGLILSVIFITIKYNRLKGLWRCHITLTIVAATIVAFATIVSFALYFCHSC
jgi:hypothetical protein